MVVAEGIGQAVILAVSVLAGLGAVAVLRTARSHARTARRLRLRADAAAEEARELREHLDRTRRQENDLREGADFSQALFAAAHAGLVVVDLRTRQVMDANATAAAITGVPLDELIGRIAGDCLGPVDDLGAEGGVALRRETLDIVGHDGRTRTCIRTLTRLQDGGDIALVSLLDISEQKAVEAELRQANARLERQQLQMVQSEKLASLGQLAAGVAHEINNPVGYVSSNLGTIREYVGAMRGMLELYERMAANPEDPSLRGRAEELRRREDLDFILGDLDGLLSE